MKRRKLNTYLTSILSALMLAGAGGCGLIEPPTAQIVGAKIQNVGLTEATIRFDVKVDNPYTVALPMSNVDYTLSSEGQKFLSGEANLQGTVPAKGSKVLEVPVRISYAGLINAVKGARPGGTIPYKADMGLSVDVPALGSKRLPMSKEGQIDIPSGPSFLEEIKGLTR